GAHAYEVLCRLWHGGLGGDRPYRVPEPLAFVERCRLLLMRAAPGESLHLRLGVDRAQALAGVREAARWLRALHDSAVRIGRLDQPWYMFAKLADRLSKAAATHPEELARLGAMLSRLERLAERWGEGEVVQVHGQFRPIHVFLDGARVTVIDLDRSVPSTPARDLAEFIHRLRSSLARQPAAAAEAGPLTRAFLDEYTLGRSRALRPLPFYWGFHVLVSLCRHLKRLAPGDAALQPTIDFYASEFDAALALAEAP
ncbi:MAG TPA: phosphotransferase, partial [Thermodesulfobacteriota bacterium]|nr:phosphotransferase [Thermodesulfobacteriota bacterium]